MQDSNLIVAKSDIKAKILFFKQWLKEKGKVLGLTGWNFHPKGTSFFKIRSAKYYLKEI